MTAPYEVRVRRGPKTDMAHVCEAGHRILARLALMRMTQRECAQRSQLTEGAMTRFIYGSRSPRVETAVRIANTLECSVESLFGRSGPKCASCANTADAPFSECCACRRARALELGLEAA